MRAIVVALLAGISGCEASTPEGASIDEPYSCTLVGCTSGVSWVAHLPTPLTGTTTIHVCRADDCADVTMKPSGFGDGGNERWQVSAYAIANATLVVEVHLYDDRHATDGVPFSLAVSRGGETLLDLSRSPLYGEPYYPNGKRCDAPDYYCRRAEFDVWPGSRSGLTCTGLPVEGRVKLDVPNTIAAADLVGAKAMLCHGGRCGTATFESMPCYPGLTDFSGDIGGGIEWTCDADQITATAIGLDDPARLADGDTWRLTIGRPAVPLVEVTRTVTYETNYPNGTACDAFPSRVAE